MKEQPVGSLMSRVTKFARSEQGRKLADKAQNYASSPEGKRKIEQVRRKVGKRG